ncbi:polysaccharide biosynthesis/export family protein [Pseudomonas sp. GX19020]|uniref:polysaccharide biosynthesis/export family protein n=1 Tax=Pseudomonadota TaxID=1224 RepID=UPI00089990C4|nr:polysaccharide biosynthesis/export family protein [Rhodobacter sp. 24-YEA-8]MCL4068556.1 polysaccharide biosynthesis/export family protein [Pseudomonas sp. GX19020]SEB45653.1 polysaccharide export outer membrane protein [Rhodobacter sp. 24-YEA-8]
MIGHTTRGAKALALIAIVAATASCGLPRSGPNKKEIFAGSVLKEGDAFIVSVNPRVTRATAVLPSFGFSDSFQKAGKMGSDTISNGDLLSITVFENVRDDPLLGNTGQRVSQLTEVQVDGQGFVFIPYAGRIKAAGTSVEAVRSAITRKLDAQTPDPQVQVARVAGDGSTVTINGSVSTPGVFPIEQPTRTLASMLARAGGVVIDPSTALVRVTRGGQTGKIWLKDLWANPKMDIALRPGDRIVIEEDERKFTALGATGTQTVVPFESESLSAIEALATVGGLQTMAADPTGVFVFRNEPEAIANAVLGRSDLRGDQRVVYVLDLTAPTGMFEARDFLVRDGDTVYVTEAPYVQWQKSLSVLTGSAGAAASINSAAGN